MQTQESNTNTASMLSDQSHVPLKYVSPEIAFLSMTDTHILLLYECLQRFHPALPDL